MTDQECGFCGGKATPGEIGYVHADAGERVRVSGPGDFVSARHNMMGTRINPADLVDSESDDVPHVGHYSRLGGTYWCDTCDSPYCELA